MLYENIFLFLKLVDNGSYSQTAKVLNLGQGTVSRLIKELEQNLGLSLLKRSSRGIIEMTSDGINLYEQFKELEKQFEQTLERLHTDKLQANGMLKLSIPQPILTKVLLPNLELFINEYPAAKFIFQANQMQIDMLKNDFNLAISTMMPNMPNYKVKLLHKSFRKFYASPTYITAYGTPLKPQDLVQHRLNGSSINNKPFSELTINHIADNSSICLKIDSTIYTNNNMANLDIAKKCHYIINCPEIIARDEVSAGNLVEILPEYHCGEQSFYLIRHTIVATKLEQLFCEFIERCFNCY